MPEPVPTSNIGLYRSGVTSPERLRHTTVAREHVLENTIASLRGSVPRKSKGHLLFIGPRGIGKTHLLSCIEEAVRSDTVLDERIVVARFPEESNRISLLRRLPDRPLRDPLRGPQRRGTLGGTPRRSRDRGRRRQGRRHAGARHPGGEPPARPHPGHHDREPGRDPVEADPRRNRRCRPAQVPHGRQRLPAGCHGADALRRHHGHPAAVLRLLRHPDAGGPGLRGNGRGHPPEPRMGEAQGPARVHGRHEAATGGALSHDGRESTADDDAVRADCPRVGYRGAGAVPRAARPDLAVLPGPGWPICRPASARCWSVLRACATRRRRPPQLPHACA